MAAGDGLVSMTPSSIAYSGTSASINADGGVDFSAVTSLSLNGVFTGDYDNYVVVMSNIFGSGSESIWGRLRVAGSDATGTDYTYLYIRARNTTLVAARTTGATYFQAGAGTTAWSGDTTYLYGPALAQPTAVRNVTGWALSGASIEDAAATHSLSTAYDGLTLFPNAGSITGTVHVFGYEE